MRLALGAIMIAHGYHKVWGGFHHHMDMVGSLGLPRWMAYLSAGTEFVGGIALVLGLFTRFFSLAIVIEMAIAIWKVHFKYGLMGHGPGQPGFEFPLALATIAFALLCFGGGPVGHGIPPLGRHAKKQERLSAPADLAARLATPHLPPQIRSISDGPLLLLQLRQPGSRKTA